MMNEVEKLENAIKNIKNLERSYGNANIMKQPLILSIQALERQIPMQPIIKPTSKDVPKTHSLGRLISYYCPSCGKIIVSLYENEQGKTSFIHNDVNGCSRCLQKIDLDNIKRRDEMEQEIDWSDEDEKS